MTHTPGPWHTDESKSFYVFGPGSLAEQAGVENGPFVCNASTKANARLIAAAPEMFEACKAALDLISVCRQYFPKSVKNPDRFQLENTCATLFKALSKTEGR